MQLQELLRMQQVRQPEQEMFLRMHFQECTEVEVAELIAEHFNKRGGGEMRGFGQGNGQFAMMNPSE